MSRRLVSMHKMCRAAKDSRLKLQVFFTSDLPRVSAQVDLWAAGEVCSSAFNTTGPEQMPR